MSRAHRRRLDPPQYRVRIRLIGRPAFEINDAIPPAIAATSSLSPLAAVLDDEDRLPVLACCTGNTVLTACAPTPLSVSAIAQGYCERQHP